MKYQGSIGGDMLYTLSCIKQTWEIWLAGDMLNTSLCTIHSPFLVHSSFPCLFTGAIILSLGSHANPSNCSMSVFNWRVERAGLHGKDISRMILICRDHLCSPQPLL